MQASSDPAPLPFNMAGRVSPAIEPLLSPKQKHSVSAQHRARLCREGMKLSEEGQERGAHDTPSIWKLLTSSCCALHTVRGAGRATIPDALGDLKPADRTGTLPVFDAAVNHH